MATYPTGVFAPTSKNAGDTIQPSHINDVQAEITAVEDALKNGIAHGLTIGGATTISTGGLTVSTGSVNITAPSSLATLNVTGGSTLASLHVASTASFDSSVTVASMTVTGALTVGTLTQSIPSVRLSLAADLQFTSGTELSPNWTVQEWTVGGMHSTTTNSSRITFAHSTGLYVVGAVCATPIVGTDGVTRRLRLRFNDTSPLGAVNESGVSSLAAIDALSVTDTVRATSTTDYVTVRYLCNEAAGSTRRILSGAGGSASSLAATAFWAYKVS